ncbi:MAG TPA: M4 family metallopeptidase, partial [Blastocatellia bacterium]|nr:M4 family metallopeptidase [Blastocatellia bacterium]
MKRLLVITLATALAISSTINYAPTRAQVGAPSASDRTSAAQKGFSPEQERALRELAPKLSQFDVDENGVPSWLRGDLGQATGEPETAALEAMRRLAPAFRMTADDGFEVRKSSRDEEGQTHVRLRQRYRGLLVVGHEMIVHLQDDKVVGVNGHFFPDVNVSNRPSLDAETALATARRSLPAVQIQETGPPELVIFVAEPDPTPWLAWSQMVAYTDGAGEFQREQIFADAHTGRLLGSHAQLHSAKFRKVYDCNNATQLPGTLVWQEGQIAIGLDQAESGARSGTGTTYDFYKNVFSRDSYDNAGSPLVSSVHYGNQVNNAYWDKTLKQMIYGDGDGQALTLTSTGLDVTAHELTHGVTQFEANLVYNKEPGALNEAFSDILGESVDYFFNGSTDWKIGEDVWTPNVAGDALRYMDNPTLDNYSADYY